MNLGKIEFAASKLNCANIALMTILDGRDDRDLDDIHHVIQTALAEIKEGIEEDMGNNLVRGDPAPEK